MTIQSFKNAELENVIFGVEEQEEWKELAAELGMGAQLSFVKAAKSPLPYPLLNQSMQNVFGALCPSKAEFKAYSKTPIPLEVLKELSFCVKENYFSTIHIWYDDKAPDPIAVGTVTRHQAYYKDATGDTKSTAYEFESSAQAKNWCETMGHTCVNTYQETNQYIIARWADELRPMPELKAMALERLKDRYVSEWSKALKELQSKLASAEETLNLYLLGEISEWDLRRNL
jgi:hypothetical protein